MIAHPCVSPSSHAPWNDTVQSTIYRSKMIEAQQKRLIQKRLTLNSPPLDYDFENEGEQEQNENGNPPISIKSDSFKSQLGINNNNNNYSSSLQRPASNKSHIHRSRVPPPLNFSYNGRKIPTRYIPAAMKSAPIRMNHHNQNNSSHNFRKTIQLRNAAAISLKYIPVRNFYNNSIVLVPVFTHNTKSVKSSNNFNNNVNNKQNHIPRSAGLLLAQVPMDIKQRSTSLSPPPSAPPITAHSKALPPHYSRISKPKLNRFPIKGILKTRTPITPQTAKNRKKVSTPIVADIFLETSSGSGHVNGSSNRNSSGSSGIAYKSQNLEGKKSNKLAPYESQPLSARSEYFSFSDSDLDEAELASKNHDYQLEDDDDVESRAIEDDAVLNESNNEGHFPKFMTLQNEIKINGKPFQFEVKQMEGHMEDSKTVFLNKCAAVWNKYVEQGSV